MFSCSLYLYSRGIFVCLISFFFFKQKTAYEMRISDWSSDVCSSDLYGSGKTRFLLVIGALAYKAFFGSGASTVSPLFHIQDAFRGTLALCWTRRDRKSVV